jgi:hypothetical protein
MLLLFRLNDAGTENVYNNTGELIAQENIATIVSIIEYDFRKIGYSKDLDELSAILQISDVIPLADSTHIRFRADVDDVEGFETIDYYTGPTSELLSTPNPRDRYLYRVINGETPVRVNLGVTHFRLRYFDGLGEELTDYPVAGAQRIQIDVAVENIYAYDQEHYDSTKSQVFWRQIRLSAQNLKRR